MNRRSLFRLSLFRLLLSLLLLLSQQMAMSHAMAHAMAHLDSGAGGVGQVGKVGAAAVQVVAQAGRDANAVAKALAKDQTCNQCLAFAQLAAPMAAAVRAFVPGDPAAVARAAAGARPACARTVCVFHSRAPPTLV